MILNYLARSSGLSPKNHLQAYLFAKAPKKKVETQRGVIKNKGFDPYKGDYSRIPQNIRKGVQANIEAKNMLVPSQGLLESEALRQVIIEERRCLYETLSKIGKIQTLQQQAKQKQSFENLDVKHPDADNKYDLQKSLKFLIGVNNILTALGTTGFGILFALQKFEALGMYAGLYLNPAMATVGGLSIGFNCASWILRQSLHLQFKEQKDLTVDKINLTSCGYMMHLSSLGIALQSFSLGYYLISWQPHIDIEWLIFSLVISQSQLVLNTIGISNGFRFQYLAKFLYTQVFGVLIMAGLLYISFKMIKNSYESMELQEAEDQVDMNDTLRNQTLRNAQVRMGYERFLSIFRTKDFQVIAGEKINQMIID